MQPTNMAFRMIGIEPSEYQEEFIMGRCNYVKAGIQPPVSGFEGMGEMPKEMLAQFMKANSSR